MSLIALAKLHSLPVKGFLPPAEAERLFELGVMAAPLGPMLEIGSYCGKSTLYLGSACKQAGAVLFCVDHHQGSEEQQPGEAFHDPELVNPATGEMDTLPFFRETLRRADLSDCVVPLVAPSHLAAAGWSTPLSLVFIDGGHTFTAAVTDYVSWSSFLKPGGLLVIHDIFERPEEGGQAPYYIYNMALSSGLYEELPMKGSLGALRKKSGLQLVPQPARPVAPGFPGRKGFLA
ncbi:MAG: class I SAM-dependent methyltransferase [Thermodesulfobacteriota bacterium]